MDTIVRILFFHCIIGWAMGEELTFCPGDQASIRCDSNDDVVWSGTIFGSQCPSNSNEIIIEDLTTDNINDTYTCGSFVVTVIDVGMRTTNLGDAFLGSTTLLTFSVVSNALDQRLVRCRDGGQTFINANLSIPVIPTPSVSVNQDSLTAVTVNLTAGDSRCASLYFVEVTQMDSSDPPIVTNSSSPSINVTGLELCMNRYSVVGYVQAPSGLQGGSSSPYEIQVDLSVLQGVINVTVTTSSILRWTQLPNTRSDCINDYTISWSDGQVTRNIETTATAISATELNAKDFPYCLTLTVTVTPNTRVGPVSSGASSANVLFQQPGLVAPEIQAKFTQSDDGSFQITVEWEVQLISVAITPTRLYGFVEVGSGECQLQFPGDESGGLESQIVSGAMSGDQYRVCVEFASNDCIVSTTITETVPQVVFSDTQTASSGDNGFSVTVTLLPSPPLNMSSFDLLIYSTIVPRHASAVSANYTSSQQHVVTFNNLIPGTMYTYDIRVVLRNDSTNTAIGLPLRGSYTVPACGTVCVTAVVVVVCVLVVLVVLVVVLCIAVCFAYKYKNRSKDPKERSVKSSKSEDAEKHELTHSSPPPGSDSLYADPNTIEHQAAPGTEDQYAMVDRKVKKNTKSKPTPPEALYQDPNTIEHETAASGDTYAVVDKPKRSSKKKGGPDVIPSASEGLTYADIDLSSKRPKPGSGRQAPQQPGEYPKEHPVEYSSVDHGNTSQL